MEQKHHYGKNVHLLNSPLLLSLVAKLGHPKTFHPDVPDLLRMIYQQLAASAFSKELPSEWAAIPTRMKSSTPRGVYRGPILKRNTKIVVASIARAGMIPADVCFEMLNRVVDPANVRLDHVTMARLTDKRGRVRGVSLSASKIGGSVQDAILVIPDPMGATGSTAVRLLQYYQESYGTPKKAIVLPMIATPEFFKNLLAEFPETVIYAARLDRGFSSTRALRTAPGKYWDEERGLNEHQYIVPGAGGMGEVLTNSWV